MSIVKYEVAHIHFAVEIEENEELMTQLTSYQPFICDDCQNVDFRLSVKKSYPMNSIAEVGVFPSGVIDFKVMRWENGYIFHLSEPNQTKYCMLQVSDDFSSAVAVLDKAMSVATQAYLLNNCLMLQYAFASAQKGCLLVHASVVENNGFGYLFLGKSGTGKSTHSRLWLEYIAKSRLLNDDNPIVRIENGKVEVYGSPWSGKTPCYINRYFPIKGIVRIVQYQENKMVKMKKSEGFASLLASCSTMPWDDESYDAICNNVVQVVERTGMYQLKCRPDREAAELCYQTVQ